MIRLFLIFTILLSNFSTTYLFTQKIEPKFERLSPVVIPNCVLQDTFGFIWIGAQEGLLRYDGYQFKRFNQIPFDTTSLSTNWVSTLQEDRKGNLWVGTWGGGLNYFDQKTEKFTQYIVEKDTSVDMSSVNISSMILNDDGSLWLGTQEAGLIYMSFDQNGKPTYKYYNLSNNPDPPARSGENFVLKIFKDSRNKLWIGTIEGGLTWLDPETDEKKNYKHDPRDPSSLSSNIVSSICEDDSSNIWVGTGHFMWQFGGGLNKLDPTSGKFTHYIHDSNDPESISSNNISSLLIDHEGILWIGTIGNYLDAISVANLYSGQKPDFTHYRNFDRNIINSIYEDRLGNIWISLFGRAVHIFNRLQNPFIWYRYLASDINSLRSSAAMVQTDKTGNIWFGGGALDCYDPKTGHYFHYYFQPDNPKGLSSTRITSICEDKYGFYWIGTDNGLNRLNPKTDEIDHIQKNLEDPFGLKSNIINEVLESRSGDLWIASHEKGIQLYNIDKNLFYHFDLDTSSTVDEATVGIYEDHTGILWSQTFNHGLYALKVKDYEIEYVKHYVHHPNNPNSLSYNMISDVICPRLIDSTALWIATGNGLNRLDLNTETFTHFFKEDGLPSNNIMKLLEDDEGNIWCTCTIGLAVYNVRTGKIKSYGKGDGMPIVEFGSRNQNACKTADGQLIFGTAIGALGFYPEQLKENTIVPPIYLTDFKIFNKQTQLDTAIQFKKKIILDHDQNMFSFEFSALNFTNSQKNQYAYQMAGLYDDWIHLHNKRSVSFTNLDPGKYIFRVKGSNNHGVWNEESTSIEIIIDPPFWQTAWFRIISGIFFLSLLVLTVRYLATRKLKLRLQELEYQRKLDSERERISKDMHDEVGSSLTRIAILSELAKKEVKTGKGGKQHIEDISQSSREVVDNIGEIIWAINPQNDSMENLIAYARQYVSNFCELSTIHCVFDLPEQIPEVSLSAKFRRNIFLVIKEATTNILKHACASEVLFQIRIMKKRMTIEIKDNGRGFSMEKLSQFGNGLNNMKHRIEQLGGEWEINSAPGKGTQIHVEVQLLA